MAVKIAINGYGRIGRNIMRAIYESGRTDEFQVVAINDLADAATNAHLTQYDTAHGIFPGKVGVDGGDLIINGDRIVAARCVLPVSGSKSSRNVIPQICPGRNWVSKLFTSAPVSSAARILPVHTLRPVPGKSSFQHLDRMWITQSYTV